jgi:hypothetical protein
MIPDDTNNQTGHEQGSVRTYRIMVLDTKENIDLLTQHLAQERAR